MKQDGLLLGKHLTRNGIRPWIKTPNRHTHSGHAHSCRELETMMLMSLKQKFRRRWSMKHEGNVQRAVLLNRVENWAGEHGYIVGRSEALKN
jgi:hypothetical protein